MSAPVIVLGGGGTGGHIMPLLAVARALRSLEPQVELHWVGAPGSMEEQRAAVAAIPFHAVPLHPFMGKPLRQKLAALTSLPFALGSTASLLRRLGARAVAAFGGYVSLAVGLVAPWLDIPLLIQEQNSMPGRTTRLLARRAQVACVGFPATAEHLVAREVICTGNPLRAGIAEVGTQPRVALPPLRVLVLGGSQGAAYLNENAPKALAALGGELDVVHQVGRGQPEPVIEAYRSAGITARVETFIEDMPALYARSHVAIARSGASSVGELMAAGVPAVLVPFPHAVDDHQFHNARSMERTGGAVILRQEAASPASMAEALLSLSSSYEILDAHRQVLHAAAPAQSAERIADRLLALAAGGTR